MGQGRIENLTPWKKGQSGNPKGPPRPFAKIVQDALGTEGMERLGERLKTLIDHPEFWTNPKLRDQRQAILDRFWPAKQVIEVAAPIELRSGPSLTAFSEALEISHALELQASIPEPETDVEH